MSRDRAKGTIDVSGESVCNLGVEGNRDMKCRSAESIVGTDGVGTKHGRERTTGRLW